MAAAIGIPDEVKGESIALYVVPSLDVEPDDELTGRSSLRRRPWATLSARRASAG